MQTINIPVSEIPFATKKAAAPFVGGLSNPSKIPGKSIGLPARECNVGSKLRKIPGSTCHSCYAMKGMYSFPVVQDAQYDRFSKIYNPEWIPAMVTMIGNDEVFRWHDSGDIQNLKHLENIVAIINETPDTNHWIPTHEKGVLAKYIAKHGKRSLSKIKNLSIRLSGAMVDGDIPKTTGLAGVNTCTVHQHKKAKGKACVAPLQNDECQDCRACWDKSIANISYHKH